MYAIRQSAGFFAVSTSGSFQHSAMRWAAAAATMARASSSLSRSTLRRIGLASSSPVTLQSNVRAIGQLSHDLPRNTARPSLLVAAICAYGVCADIGFGGD